MDVSSVMQKVADNFNNELRETILEALEVVEIPVCPPEERNEKYLLTIFVTDTNTKRKKNGKRNPASQLKIQFTDTPEKDLTKSKHDMLLDIAFIWNILKAEYVEYSRRKISALSREIFKKLTKLYEENDLHLVRVSFELSIDENGNLKFSKFPEFKNLLFSDTKNYSEYISGEDFLASQANSILAYLENSN